MDARCVAGAYFALLGVLMVVYWSVALAAGQVPEVRTAPLQLGIQLGAEMLTAAMALAAGLALLRQRPSAYRAYLLASGLMVYSMTTNVALLAQQSQYAAVAFFATLLGATVALLFLTRREAPTASPAVATAAR